MENQIRIILTEKDSENLLNEINPIQWSKESDSENHIQVFLDKPCQTIMGFGGAFTEAAAITLSKVNDEQRREVIDAYYDPLKGIGYNLGRVHINSCDFALDNYSYVEDFDSDLNSFNISHDESYIIPLIQDALAARSDKIDLLASPWSPPWWMKTNENMNHGGQLKPEYFQSWALYYTKFIKAYEAKGIPIWGITIQNEPAAVQTWDSCIYSGEEERDFLKHHLGPMMVQEALEDVKILIWDHNRDIMVERATAVLSDREAAKYVWGTAFHWYVSEAFENVAKVHDLFPDKHLLFTEGCQEGGCKLGEWFTGERYGRNIMGDMNNWCEGYIDWNLVLDETGGPNHVNNLCDAPIIVDTIKQEIHYNSSYYYIGHFSKFVQRGAKRLEINSKMKDVNAIAFMNPTGELVLVGMNETDESVHLSFQVNEQFINVSIPAHGIVTAIATI